ncbi:restriction endonuclease subunit S [Turicibacter sp. 1E2]|uniref:restriction endonuclease subunit S n=1 Tax=Turicibacter sp. 1E2 TaxID=2951143 RepID=UPI0021D50DC0|nr:restriction endonuclease subunit S [Turicibacter sp. 1E2]MCU7209443.1 restriction endonuclease subunit S [Turicibacter sp. 1E2]
MKAPGYQNINNIKLMQQNIGCNILAFSDILEDLTSSVTKVKKDEYSFIGEYSIIDQGKEFIAGYYNSNQGISSSGPHIVFGDHTRIFKYVDFPILLGADGTKLLSAKISDVNMKYLYYFFNTLSLPNDGYSRHFKYLKQVVIPLPNIQYQNKIANILDQAQRLIDKRKEQIALLDELVQSVFYDMFGDPVINDRAWNLEKLKNLGALKRGKSSHRPRNAPELLNGPYPLIQTGDIANAGLYLNDYTTTYSELGLKQSKLWSKGTLCITIAANIAKTTIITFDACFPDSVVAFLNKENIVNKMYIQIWMSFLQKIIEDGAPESAQKNINLKILGELDVILPPIELQNHFAEMVENIEKQKELLSKSLAELETNFHSLMQRAFRGELVVE